jgi:hypothetical protein
LGTYRELQQTIVRVVLNRTPETMGEAKDYATKTFDIANLVVDRWTVEHRSEEFVLRPVVEDDESPMNLSHVVH